MLFPLWSFPPSRGETPVHVQIAARISDTEFLETHSASHPLTYLPPFWGLTLSMNSRDVNEHGHSICAASQPVFSQQPQLDHAIVHNTPIYRYPNPIDKPTFLGSISLPKPLYIGLCLVVA